MDTVRIVVQRTTLRVQLGSVPVSVGAGGVSDGDKGDIAVSSSGTVWTVEAVGGQTAAAVAAHVAVAHQPLDADLTAIAALSTTGYARRTGASTWTLSVPTAADVGALTQAEADTLYDLTGAALDAETAANAYTDAALAGKQDQDPVLDALVLVSGAGILTQSAPGTFNLRTLQTSGAGLSLTNGGGVAGDPTLSLSGDVAAIEALAGTGWAQRTGSNTWTLSVPTASDVGAQALDAGLTSLLAVDTAGGLLPYTTAASTWAGAALTAAGRALLDDADAAAQRATLGLGDAATRNVGTTSADVAQGDHAHAGVYQPSSAELSAIAALGGTGTLKRTGAATWSFVTPLGSVTVTIDVQGGASSGTYTAPAGAVLCWVRGWGGGGGGGGGRRDDTATTGSAGVAGQSAEAGAFVELPATLNGQSWTVGAAGTSGPGRTGSTGSGTAGGNGGDTTFAGRRWRGGLGGSGGTASGLIGAAGTSTTAANSGRLASAGLGTPSHASTANTVGAAGSPGSTTGGGGSGGNGGGLASGTTAYAGGQGGHAPAGSGGGAGGAGATAAPGTAGSPGTQPTPYEPGGGGGGGGNAGAAGTGTAGAGGDGGAGAGGGGGGSAHGCDAGSGGAGGGGGCHIFTLCIVSATA